ncbi:MAG TPA: sensor domain-containing diguanylate cyclase [Rhodocyclaceae bacterium]|nr:sensor domain-containing diguanylate cyclase [Rhodocyclaceae bacterium]
MSTIDNVPAQHHHVVLAMASAASLAVVALWTLPVIDEPWGFRPWFPTTYLACSFVLEGLIALFLALQVLAGSQTRGPAWLSGAYAYTAIIALALFLTFPDILDPPLLPQASGDLPVWLWVAWHAGFPCFVLLAVGAQLKPGRAGVRSLSERLFNLFPLLVGVVLAAGTVSFLLLGPMQLPSLTDGDNYGRLSRGFVGGAMVTLDLFALATLIARTRLREIMCLWLAVAMFGFTLDILLTMAAMERYTAGWYVGHCVSMASSAALIMALMIEHFNLQHAAEVRAAFHEQEALHDPLTGVFNRRHLISQLSEELGRARRYRYPVSVLMLDLDHFKRINDSHGHAVGDHCLRSLAQALSERPYRHGDFSARYGGEEFVVVLAETGVDGAVEVAEQLRSRIESLHDRGIAPCPMTASIGIATANSAEPTTPDALLAAADECLYRAKQQGRNRVVWPQKSAELVGVKTAGV